MSTRVRYKSQNGTLVSKVFKTPANSEVVINIKPDGTFAICTTKGELVFNSTNNSPTSLETAKKYAKSALIELGVVFENEVRPRIKKLEVK